MDDLHRPRTRSQKVARALFWLLLAAWTFVLEMPISAEMASHVSQAWTFTVAKCLHLSIFATEMILGLYWPATARGRWGTAAVLSAQAALTELVQYLLSDHFHRHGCVQDVLIDHIGLGVGALAYFGVRAAAGARRNAAGEKAPAAGPV